MKLIATRHGRKFGIEANVIRVDDQPYLSRWIVWFGWGSIRLHKFWRGDQVRAPHDHPWTFWTFPFKPYMEYVFSNGETSWGPYEIRTPRHVEAYRWHKRGIGFKHIVVRRSDGRRDPWYTLVVTGPERQVQDGAVTRADWGFWTEPGVRVPWWEWPTC